jgi:phenylacetate-CoA ligase
VILSDDERLERDALEGLQLERLKRQLARVEARIEPIARRWQEAGVGAADVGDLRGLARLPFMTKSDLRDHYPTGLFGAALGDSARVQGSSGTRGKPTIVGYSRADLELWSLLVARCLALAGAVPGQVLQNAYGYGLFTGGLGLHQGAERLGLCVLPLSGGQTQRQILFLEDFHPDGIACTPSYLLNIMETLGAEGREPRTLGLKWAILGAEPWSEDMRQVIEAGFGLTAVDIYGLSEVIGPGVSCECAEAQDGLHVQEDHVLVEVVDPVTGQPLPPGATGELVFTTLSREISPVVRYRSGDIASLDLSPCRCGRTTARMSKVKGRTDDMLVVRGVNLFPSEIEAVVSSVEGLLPVHRIVLRRPRALDEVTIQVECAGESGALAQRLEQGLLERLGVGVRVEVLAPMSLPRSEGKAARVLDER